MLCIHKLLLFVDALSRLDSNGTCRNRCVFIVFTEFPSLEIEMTLAKGDASYRCWYVLDVFPKVEFVPFYVTCGRIDVVFNRFCFSRALEARA